MKLSSFEKLVQLNVNDKIEKRTDGKTELSYLSWAFAWSEFKKVFPEAQYEMKKFADQKGVLVPYMFDPESRYMVNTTVTADGLTYEMWLPVMDSKNKAMRETPYTYTTKNGEKTVEKATMFDVNKTIMRCLVKNLAMFGLGLYIYAGEDLPEEMGTTEAIEENKKIQAKSITEQIAEAQTDEELSSVYRVNKKEICSNPKLLDMITEKGRKLKGVA
jgi:hypothetical protein